MRMPARLWAILLIGVVGLPLPARPEDEVVTQTQTFRGKVKAATGAGVTIEIPGRGEMTIPRATVVKLTVEPPPSVLRAIADYERGNLKEARLGLGKVMLQYQGLDVDWASKGTLYYGQACLQLGDYDNAAKAYQTFIKEFPDDPRVMEATLGLADIDLAKKDYAAALPRLQELGQTYDNLLKPGKQQMPYAARIYLLIGKCQEGLNEPAAALEAYLRVIALYPAENAGPEALYRGARLYTAQKQPEQAEKLLTELVEQYGASEFAKKARAENKNLSPRPAAAETSAKPAAP